MKFVGAVPLQRRALCRQCGQSKHRDAAGRFVKAYDVCPYYQSVAYKVAVQDFHDTLESMTDSLMFFRDEHGRRVNEDPAPLHGGLGCMA